MIRKKAIYSWSGGKDSALGLFKLLQESRYDVIELMTNVSQTYQRISMHGVRRELLECQAQNIGIALNVLELPEMPSMEVYDSILGETLSRYKSKGIEAVAFGDIFLEDLKKYREDQLFAYSLEGVFPLWKKPTNKLISEFIDLGFKTIVTCVNEKYLDKSFVGRIIDEKFISDLPASVDPCGENGEFHTFVFDGPIFKKPVLFSIGEKVYKKYTFPESSDNSDFSQMDQTSRPYDTGFWFCELYPKS